DDSRNDAFTLGRMPVVIYGEDDIPERLWRDLVESYPFRKVHSSERLLDTVTLFLHREVATLGKEFRAKLAEMHESDKLLAGKRVLVVDDDARNIFALTTVLEEHHMNVLPADSGREAIDILEAEKDIDLVLMDIMMPEMDGMETI